MFWMLFIFVIIFGLTLAREFVLDIEHFSIKKCIKAWRFWRVYLINSALSVFIFSAVNYDYFAILKFSIFRFFIFFAISVCVTAVGAVISYSRRTSGVGRVCTVMLICMLCAVVSEIFIFNSRAIQSHEYSSVELLDKGETNLDDPIFGDTYELSAGSSVKFAVDGISIDIKNIYVGADIRSSDGDVVAYKVKIYATDKANANGITSIPQRTVYGNSPSQYIPLQLSGVSDELRVEITSTSSKEDAIITLSSISVNTPKPFELSFPRTLMIFLILFGLYLISPKSPMHSMLLERSALQTCITIAVIVLEIVLIFVLIASSSHFLQNISKHQAQYQELAESLCNGHLYLEEKVADFLLEMENPYDYGLRASYGKYFYWDAALYGEHYYVYFGVVPCLLLYFPYHLITDKALPNDIAVFIFAIIFIIGVFALVRRIKERYFADTKMSYLTYLLICLLAINGSGLIFIASYADMYSVPIMAALAFTTVGLSLWLSALNNKSMRVLKLALGSLCMALVAGCRPNLLLFSFLCIPIFWGEISLAWKEKRIFKRESVKNFIAFALPYVIVAIGIMWYNYKRFESPFDFGANYNLTTNDMTSRGFVWDRMLPAAYSYLFQLPKMTATFPFIRYADFDTTYMGVTIKELTYGGVFSYSPLLWLIFAIPALRGSLREKHMYAPALILAVCGVVTALLDAQFAGILQRYFSDFSFMLYLSAIFVLFAVIDAAKTDGQKKAIRSGLFICAVLMICYQGALSMRVGQLSDVLPYMFWY